MNGGTITSRGCPERCPWCFVPKREGPIRELTIKPGYIVQDNNLLACSAKHIENVFDMLRDQRRAAVFKGGLSARLLVDRHRELIDSIRVSEIWIACDTQRSVRWVERASKILDGIPIGKRRVYMMIGYEEDESIASAEKRIEKVFSLGFLPFTQLYQGENMKVYSKEWRALASKWSRPAAYRPRKHPKVDLPRQLSFA